MKFLVAGVLSLLVGFQVFSQNPYLIKPENSDCTKAIEIKDTLFGPTNAPQGYGSVMEITGDKSSLYAFEKEHNTVWYFFRAKNDCQLEITIIPEKINDDYDFILFKYSGKTFCDDVVQKKINPVRTCISRNDKKNNSKTGLSKTATDEFIHSGPGASFAKNIDVKKGEVYYLCVDNVYPKGGGHTVILHYSGCKPPPVLKTKTSKEGGTKPVVGKTTTVTINIVDKDTHLPVKANLKIFLKKQVGLEKLFSFDSISTTQAKLPLNGIFNLKTEAANYFDNVMDVKVNATGQEFPVTIELSRIKVGQNVIFEKILFFGNSAQFLPESKPVLQGLETTLKRNPGLKIEIQGHVNCPLGTADCGKLEESNMQLSINRAKAVYDYLVKVGITATRMTYKGFGNTKMIYPDARSEEKMAKNRRVEIKVTAF